MVAPSHACADQVAALFHTLVPPEVWRAEWMLLGNDGTEEERTCALRALLDFHADVVTPLSELFAFALPSCKALNTITQLAPHGVVEVGAGNGLWAEMLRRSGIKVVAIDDGVRHDGSQPQPFGPVHCGGPEIIASAGRDPALLLCWPSLELELPPFHSNGETDPGPNLTALNALRMFEGDILFVVGEWSGRTGLLSGLSWRTSACGQAGGSQFQRAIATGWVFVENVRVPRWPGFADQLYVFRRRSDILEGSSARDMSSNSTPIRSLTSDLVDAHADLFPRPTLQDRLRTLSLRPALLKPAVLTAVIAIQDITY